MKNCDACGAGYDDSARYCPHCGALNENYSPDMEPEKPDSGERPMQDHLNDHPMKWHRFLMVVMIIGAILTILNGFNTFTGASYGSYVNSVYDAYPDLKTADTFYGIAAIALGVFQIIVRNRLNRFERSGPGSFTVFYILAIAIDVIYKVSASSITGVSLAELGIGSAIGTAVMMIINGVYYSKRKDMFVN